MHFLNEINCFKNGLNPSIESRENYKSYRNKVTNLIPEAKRMENFRKLGKNPDCKTNKTLGIKKRQQQGSTLPDLELLNEYFATIGSKLSSELLKPKYHLNLNVMEKTMVVYQTDAAEVSKIIHKMKSKKSYGEDGISNEMIKFCTPVIEDYIAKVFNTVSKKKHTRRALNSKNYSYF